MPRPRKTANVQDLKRTINARIAAEPSLEGRKALVLLLGDILWSANAYNGFGYIGGWTGTEDYRQFFY
jgi:hypothetical protein